MREHDSDVREMMQRLGRALLHAAARSDEVAEVVRQIRQEGYSLSLILEPSAEPLRRPQLELSTRPEDAARRARGTALRRAAAAQEGGGQSASSPEPAAFRLGGRDVDFLSSIGIDPTRPAARRRRNQSR